MVEHCFLVARGMGSSPITPKKIINIRNNIKFICILTSII